MKQILAFPVPRVDYMEVAISNTVYIEGPRSSHDYMPILHFTKPECGNAKAVTLPDHIWPTIEESSSLNNRLFCIGADIISYKRLYAELT